MKHTRIAQTLRNLSLKPSLESGDDAPVVVDIMNTKEVQTDCDIVDETQGQLTTKLVDVGERSDLESSETEVKDAASAVTKVEDAETADVVADENKALQVSQESLLAIAAISAMLAIGSGLAFNKAAKLQNQWIDISKKIALKRSQLDQLVIVAENNARAELKKAKVSQESLSGELKDLDEMKTSTGMRRTMAVAGGASVGAFFAVGAPVAAAFSAGLAGVVLLSNIAAVRSAGKELDVLEQELIDKEIEIAQLAAEAKSKGASVSQESIDDVAVQIAQAVAEGANAAAEAVAAAAANDSDDYETADDASEAAIVAPDTEAEAIAGGDAEIEAIEQDIDDGEQHAEEYEQAATTMESLVDALDEARQSGGLTPQAAKFLKISFESVGIRLTGEPFKNSHGESPIPSMESFGGTMRRDEATSVSMESVKEWFAKIMEVLKKTWKQLVEWVKKFVAAILDQGARYTQRAEAIAAAAVKIGSGKAKNATINIGKTADAIALGNKVDAANFAPLKLVAEDASDKSALGETYAKAFATSMAAAAEKTKTLTGDTGLKNVVEALVTLGFGHIAEGGMSNLRSKLFTEEVKDGLSLDYRTAVLPGNVRLVMTSFETNQDGIDEKDAGTLIKASLRHRLRIGKTRVEHEGVTLTDTDRTVATLTLEQIRNLAGEVKSMIVVAKNCRRGVGALNVDFQSNVVIAEDANMVTKKVVQVMANSAAKTCSDYAGGVSKLLKYAIGTSGSFLDYAAASLKQYGAEVPAGKSAITA